MARVLKIDGRSMTFADLKDLIADRPQGSRIQLALAPSAERTMTRSRAVVEKALSDGRPVYGVNTGFGRLSETRIAPERLEELQSNLLRSHACGSGPHLERPGLLIALRANSLVRGPSGVTPGLVRMLIDMYNRGFEPCVPVVGSVGASGDLAPLAELGVAMMGEGTASAKGLDHGPSAGALRRTRLKPYRFRPKEALSLINGTQLMTTLLAEALVEAETLLKLADIAGAMTLEALKGSHKPFDARVHAARPHPGQAEAAANFRKLLARSEVMESHRDCVKVQDAYSVRCMPQVHGAAREAFGYARRVLLIEINSATDNPLVLGGDVISAGNFHGQPVAQAADFMAIAMASAANISERRIERMTNPDLSGLPAFLVRDSGVNSGFMMVQVAAAALAAECRVDATPASVQSLPTGAAKEDHVSMGPLAARKCRRVIENLKRMLSLEAACAAQALDFLKPLKPGLGVAAAHEEIRRRSPHLERDVHMRAHLEKIDVGCLVTAVERAVGRLT
ncbi:MAG: histidine ammonia-lyase [Planctomycetes bacterium]|nr:histidine ammonia-lyase [Planctomycetota bacterium]